MHTVTRTDLIEIMPECAHVVDKYTTHLNEAFDRFEINTSLRQAAFISQIGHESTRLTRTEENLNYSANGLIRTFPNHFTPETAKDFAYKPARIANRVYANKGGNGDESSGDGWKFRGRGLIQITLLRNYQIRGKRLVEDVDYFVNQPDLLISPEWAVRSAADYWDENQLNQLADIGTLEAFARLTMKINRAKRGLLDRQGMWLDGMKVFGLPPPAQI